MRHLKLQTARYNLAFWAASGLVLLGVGHSVTDSFGAWQCDTALPASENGTTVKESDDYVADASTSIVFPRRMAVKIPGAGPAKDLSLLGVGVRTVSFLRVPVYVVGFYADLEGVELHKNAIDAEQKIDWLIRNRCVAVRLVPNRNTSYQHLRDAYVRSVQGRLTALRNAKDEIQLTPEQEDVVQDSILKLKALFPNSALQKNTPLQIILSPPASRPGESRSLIIPKLKGRVNDTWVGVELMRAYFAGNGVSPKMKKEVIGAVEAL